MLTSAPEILETAQLLAIHLEETYADPRGTEWTRHIFDELRRFCQNKLGIEAKDCFHKYHPDGNGEFLWDFIAVNRKRGLLLAAESEQATHNAGLRTDLKHDFEKLLYVFAPLRVLVCKARNQDEVELLLKSLTDYANDCCQNFNPGAVFVIHFCLWNENRARTYLWQSEGDPSTLKKESLEFVPFDNLSPTKS